MNTITVGQQHYQWKVQLFSWLKVAECTIYNIAAPQAQLSIILSSADKKLCTPKKISSWIDEALRQGWYSECKSYRLTSYLNRPRLIAIPNSLQEEIALVKQIVQYYPSLVPPTALERSNITYQWKALEQKLGFILPTALQQLYTSLGNGNFGPDYGFFLLETDPSIDKNTLLEAYEEVQHAMVADWDWRLPKHAVPFLCWGNNIYSIIDVSSPQYSIYVLDMNLKETHATWQECYWLHCSTFFEWLKKWAADQQSGRSLWLEMYQLRGLL